MIAPDVLLTRKDAAARLKVSIATIKRWEAAGLLDARHPGPATVRITEASVLALTRKRRDAA